MTVKHIDFKNKRELTSTEIEDKLSDEAGVLQDSVIRIARSLEKARSRQALYDMMCDRAVQARRRKLRKLNKEEESNDS